MPLARRTCWWVPATSTRIPVLFSSTNIVYANRPNLLLVELEKRWDYANGLDGMDETVYRWPSAFRLRASKVAADIMCQEFERYLRMPMGIFQGGCLTSPQHSAVELRAYLAYIIICALAGREYTVFGYKAKTSCAQIHCCDVAGLLLEFQWQPRYATARSTIWAGRANPYPFSKPSMSSRKLCTN